MKTITKTINALTSTIGTLIILITLYFTTNINIYAGIIALTIILITKLLTKTNTKKIRTYKKYATKHKLTPQKNLLNNLINGNIARAFLTSYILYTINPLLLTASTIYITITILANIKNTNLKQIIISAIIGTTSGLIAEILTKILF